jgi:hypothetical protein
VGDSIDRGDAGRLLRGLENGGMSAAEAHTIAQQLDPVLVHAIVTFLRDCYPASDPAAHAVLGRVVAMTDHHADVVRLVREGGQDPVIDWFRHEYEYRQFKGRGGELLDLLIDKLDS